MPIRLLLVLPPSACMRLNKSVRTREKERERERERESLAKAPRRGVKPANKVGAVNYVKNLPCVYTRSIVLRYALATCLQ